MDTIFGGLQRDTPIGSLRQRMQGAPQSRQCFCVGPKPGEPACPCRMGQFHQVGGRWVEVIDRGPVAPAPARFR